MRRCIGETYAGDEPEILRTDFHNSLLAAYRDRGDRGTVASRRHRLAALDAFGDRHIIA